jgi:hypothetical protein
MKGGGVPAIGSRSCLALRGRGLDRDRRHDQSGSRVTRVDSRASSVVRRAAWFAAAAAGLALTWPQNSYAITLVPVRTTPTDEFDGFAGGGFFGWVHNTLSERNRYNLYLSDSVGERVRLNRPGTNGFGGGIDATTVVYEESTQTLDRLVFYDTATRRRTNLPITDSPNASMHPTISGAWVFYTRGVRHRQTSVRLYNRATGETHQLGSATGRRDFVYAGQVAGEWAAWGQVLAQTQDVFLTNLTTMATVKIERPRGVKFQYDPAVTPTGTVFFARNRPCVRRCPKLNTPTAVNQLVEATLGGRARVLATLRKGQDAGYMYAVPEGARTKVRYSLFTWLPHDFTSYSDIFAFTVPA